MKRECTTDANFFSQSTKKEESTPIQRTRTISRQSRGKSDQNKHTNDGHDDDDHHHHQQLEFHAGSTPTVLKLPFFTLESFQNRPRGIEMPWTSPDSTGHGRSRQKTKAISSESSLTYPLKKSAHMWSGWWLSHPSEKYESQLGLVFPIYEKNETVMYQTTATSAFEINPQKHGNFTLTSIAAAPASSRCLTVWHLPRLRDVAVAVFHLRQGLDNGVRKRDWNPSVGQITPSRVN